jgi:fluoride exporter
MSLAIWLAVGALGGAGALARFTLDGIVSERATAAVPLGTLVVNLSGSVLLGLLVGLALSGDALRLAGTAALGSYTTFSTWMLESQRLGEEGRYGMLALNVVLSIATGLGAAAVGRAIGAAL